MDRWSRRQFVQGLGVAGLGLLAGCGRLPGQAQPPAKVHRIGVLLGAASLDSPEAEALRQGLRDLGYVEGQNIVIEYRLAAGGEDRLPNLATELVRSPVDVIVTGGAAATRAAQAATHTVPIVIGASGDPVAEGLIASLARPGGNVTGLSQMRGQLGGKRLELLKEALGSISRVTVLGGDGDGPEIRELQRAAQVLAVRLHVVPVPDATGLEGAFDAAVEAAPDALIMATTSAMLANPARVVRLAADRQLPAMYDRRPYMSAGGLMFYGASAAESYRRAATYVDRILRGANPADLPVEQPREFDFIINLKVAQALGLTIPQHVLLQATEVVQ
jgi:putative ABC transport system substrate-binding protein